jgi:diacylglycerol kinase (ATP)
LGIAAVGGDGTVNEVGRALVHSEAVLAIIPVGSGNGLARHLGIPVGLKKGIKALNHAYPIVIDTGKINDKIFLGVAGIGFDAHIAHKFALFGKRGFFSYCQVASREFSLYAPQSYFITIDGKQITKKAFILTFANSSQYGNNFLIAPKARVSDGYLDLVIIDDIPSIQFLNFYIDLNMAPLIIHTILRPINLRKLQFSIQGCKHTLTESQYFWKTRLK